MTKPTVNLCVIVTEKYLGFLLPMLSSARRYFCADFAPTFHIWTDTLLVLDGLIAPRNHATSPDSKIVTHPVVHEPWPGVTLHRFRTFLSAADSLMKNDFTFYADVDGLFVRPVGEEILSGLVAVRHPGYAGRPPTLLPLETNRQSTAYVPPKLRKQYCAGGFQGGRTDRWLQACREIDDKIRIDEKNGVMARSYDESHWNCYLAHHQELRSDCRNGAPLLLSQDYCAHEGAPYSDQNTARYISLKKNNAEFHAP